MILFSVLAAVGACVVLTLLDAFYDSIIKWLSKIGEVAQRVVKGVLIGCKTFLSDVRKNIGKEISKNYSKVGEKWQVTEVSRRLDNQPVFADSDMEDLLDKAMNQNFVPVVDDNGIFIGIVTRKDVLLYLAGKLRNH